LAHGAIFLGIVVVIALLSPWLDVRGSGAWLSASSHTLMYDIALNVILAMGLNLVLGMTGQFSIGHAGFLAAGAYAAVVVAGKPEWFVPQLAFWHGTLELSVTAGFVAIMLTGTALAIAVAAVLGLVVGLPTLRLRGDYLAIATLGFGEIVAVVIGNSDYLDATSGAGIYAWRAPWLNSEAGKASPLHDVVQKHLFDTPYLVSSFWILLGTAVTIYVVRNIKYSTSGRALLAVREDVIASEAVGVPTTRYKVTAFVIGAALAGMAGGMLSHHKQLNPQDFTFLRSVEILLIVILGGQGSITGCILAAIAVTLVPESLRSGLPRSWNLDATLIDKWRLVVYAVLIIAAMLFRPQGLMGRFEVADVWRWARRKWGAGRAEGKVAQEVVTAGISTLVAEKEDLRAGQAAQAGPLLVAENVTMNFGGLCAVDSFGLSLRAGELVGLIGPNGAGKTTVFNVLTGVYRPTRGDIRVCERSIVKLRPHAISKRGVARTFQNIRLFANLSVLDNVMIAQHAHHRQGILAAVLRTPGFFEEEAESRKRALGYMDIFGLADKGREQANSLSYGDQRRLEIARALATRPKLLLLDEPAAGMNPTEKRELMDLIQTIRSRFGLTILIIEHDMKVIMGICERIIVLDYGKTIATGTPEEIRRNPAVIEAYLGASAKQG